MFPIQEWTVDGHYNAAATLTTTTTTTTTATATGGLGLSVPLLWGLTELRFIIKLKKHNSKDSCRIQNLSTICLSAAESDGTNLMIFFPSSEVQSNSFFTLVLSTFRHHETATNKTKLNWQNRTWTRLNPSKCKNAQHLMRSKSTNMPLKNYLPRFFVPSRARARNEDDDDARPRRSRAGVLEKRA